MTIYFKSDDPIKNKLSPTIVSAKFETGIGNSYLNTSYENTETSMNLEDHYDLENVENTKPNTPKSEFF